MKLVGLSTYSEEMSPKVTTRLQSLAITQLLKSSFLGAFLINLTFIAMMSDLETKNSSNTLVYRFRIAL